MSFKIGRADVTRCVSSIEFAGDFLDVSGEFQADSLASAKALRQQLLGLVNNRDEPVVPVVSTLDPDLDGFYRVRGVTATPLRSRTFKTLGANEGRHGWTASLERVGGGYAAADIELAVIEVDRGVSTISPDGELWIPASRISEQMFDTTPVARNRTTETGDARGGQSPPPSPYGYRIAAADFYEAAAVVERLSDGVWYPTVGRQIPSSDADALRIGNGLIRFSWQTDGDMELEVFDGLTWDVVGDFTIVGGSGAAVPVAEPAILRSSPEACVVRFGSSGAGASQGHDEPVTVSIQRGQLHAVLTENIASATLDFGPKTSIASTALSSGGNDMGLYATANGATGHRHVVMRDSGGLGGFANTTTGRLNLLGVGAFGLAANLDGTSALAGDTPTALQDQFAAAMSVTQQVAAR